MSDFIKKYLTAKNIGFLAILAYLIPTGFFVMPSDGLDESFALGLNLAVKEGLIWGKDIVFTYGPLGYLSTCLPVYVSKLAIILFSLFIVSNGIYFINYLLRLSTVKSEHFFLFTVLLYVGHFLFWKDAVTLYFYFVFHLLHFLKHKNFFSLVLGSVCALLAFYIKVNTGIILNALFVLFVVYVYFFRHWSLTKSGLLLFGHFFSLFILSLILNTDLWDYLQNSILIIDAYNDAMVIAPSKWYVPIDAVLIISLIALIVIRYFTYIVKSPHELFILSNVGLLIYVLFKQSFVRGDRGHMSAFFLVIVFVVTLFILFSEFKPIKRSFYYLIIPIAFLSVQYFKDTIASRIYSSLPTAIFSEPKVKQRDAKKMLTRALPESVIAEIGNSTVDVLGYEISYVYFNGLNYNPRPVIQSYSAYHEKLIDLNYEKYRGNSAPDYVLYHFGTIDDRHPFWDEPRIYLALLARYSIVDTIPQTEYTNSMILFKRDTVDRSLEERVLLDTIIQFGQPFSIPDTEKVLYLRMCVEYSLLGKIRRVLYQPSLPYMKLNYADGDTSYHRAIIPIFRAGVPINKKVLTIDDAYDFFAFDGKNNLTTKSFTLIGNPRWLKSTVRIELVEYELDVEMDRAFQF
jgi:hypothetical protein